jgi:hypothetical protein
MTFAAALSRAYLPKAFFERRICTLSVGGYFVIHETPAHIIRTPYVNGLVRIWASSRVKELVVLKKLFEQRSGRILMTDDVVEGLNDAFVMIRKPMRVGIG